MSLGIWYSVLLHWSAKMSGWRVEPEKALGKTIKVKIKRGGKPEKNCCSDSVQENKTKQKNKTKNTSVVMFYPTHLVESLPK